MQDSRNDPVQPRLDIFDKLMGVILIAMILFSPMAFGSVAPWAQNALFLMALVMAALWMLQCARQGAIRICPSPVWILLPAVIAVVAFQLVPLSPGAMESLSPSTSEIYGRTVQGYPASQELRTLSLDPHSTKATLAKWCMLALVLLVVMNTIRTRRQIMVLSLALVAAGLFQALYGFAEQLTGHQHIFWNERLFHLDAVTGTFHNKNHFAGLLAMVIPVALGLFVASGSRRNRPGTRGNRVIDFFSTLGMKRQIVLSLCLACMAGAIFFSLSRAGILCALISWTLFAILFCRVSGFRKFTLVLLGLVVITLSLAIGMGSEMVIADLEETAAGQTASWADRADLWQSGMTMIASYPLLGTGLGTFGHAFERFQSMHFGDRFADFLHNDWLQVFCELGLVGGTLVALGILFVFYKLFRKTMGLADPFYQALALGAMTGVIAMLLHSIFDYNLYKITSNGILFAVLAGLWHGAITLARHKEKGTRSFWVIPLPSRALAWGGALVIVAAMAWPAGWALRCGLADIHFNRFLASPQVLAMADGYHFLPAGERGTANPVGQRDTTDHAGDKETMDPSPHLARALDLVPDHPRYRYNAGIQRLQAAENLCRNRAVESARNLLGPEIEKGDPAGFQQVTESLVNSLRPAMVEENRTDYEAAERLLHEAIHLSPGVSRYHLTLAGVGALLQPASRAMGHGESALWLSPSKPSVLFEAGRIFLMKSYGAGPEAVDRPTLDFAARCFRRAILARPAYAERIYTLVQSAMIEEDALIQVTPKTVSGYAQLTQRFWESGEWRDVLTCLNTSMDLLTKKEPAGQAGEPLALVSGEIHRARDQKEDRPEEIIRSLSRKRCTVLGILGDWQERTIEVSRYSRLVRDCVAQQIHEAQSLGDHGRHDDSLSLYYEILDKDWKNTEALIEAAQLASRPGATNLGLPWNRPLDLLLRVVINSPTLDHEKLDQIIEIVNTLPLDRIDDLLLADLIRGAGLVLSGKMEEGLASLIDLTQRITEMGETWRQCHLAWYYLGLGHEAAGNMEEARAAYTRVIRDVPTHLESLQRLAALEDIPGQPNPDGQGKDSLSLKARIHALQPQIPCNVNFGGKVVLLGLGLSQEKGEGDGSEEAWYITYYWMFRDRMYEGYHPLVHFCGKDWRILFQDDHQTRFRDQPYPVDYPRSGEVVVEKRRLDQDPTSAAYLRIGIATATPREFTPRHLTCDSGGDFFLTSL